MLYFNAVSHRPGLSEAPAFLLRIGGTNFTYDKNGNLANDGRRSYIYDCENRLIRAGSLLHNFKYDYRGRLVKGRFGAIFEFTYDGDQTIAAYNSSHTLVSRQFTSSGRRAGATAELTNPL